jgi:hypothetical protein
VTAAGVPGLELRFPLAEVPDWAARYAYADDTKVESIGDAAGRQGYYTRDQFLRAAKWKSPRSQPRCALGAEPTRTN